MIFGYIKKERYARALGILSSFVLAVLFTASIFPFTNSKDDVEATATPASEPTLSIVNEKSSTSAELTVDSSMGTFAASAADSLVEFTVGTDNITGYTLTLSNNGTDTTGQLSNADAGAIIDTLSSATDATTFQSGSAETYNNKWGILPNMYNSTTNTSYIPAPTTTAQTLNTTTCANGTADCSNETDSYTIGLGVRADYTKPTGTYTNTFTLAAVGNPISYQINYLDNTGDGGTTGDDVSNLPSADTGDAATIAALALSSAEPTKTNHSFIGWCDGAVTHSSTDDSTCEGITYQAGDNYDFANISMSATNTVNLYAMWHREGFDITIKNTAGVVGGPIYSKTSNIDDTGATISNTTYSSNQATKDVVTIPGATQLDVTLYYSTENSYDYVYIFQGEYTGTPSRNMNAGQLATYNGGAKSTFAEATKVTLTVPGDTATFAFYSDNSSNYYGYYAIVTSSITGIPGIDTISLNGTSCPSGSDCVVGGLQYGQSYDLVASIDSAYSFGSWDAGEYGSIADISSISTSYTVGSGPSIVTADAVVNTRSLVVTFAGSGVSSVKVCTVSGNCSGDSLKGTVSSSGGSVSGLTVGATYYLYPSFNSSYTLSSWSKTSSTGTLSSTSATNPTFTIGDGDGAVTITGKSQTYSLTITFAGMGIQSVQVRTASGTGGTLKGTVSSSGGSVSGLTNGTAYYLYPIFEANSGVKKWTKTSSVGTLSSTSASNPTFTMGAGNGAITIIGKSTLTNVGNIQNLSSSKCTTTAVQATDTRDNQEYIIQRLADGNCWMMTNLNLGDIDNYPLVVSQLSSSNSNINTAITASTFTGWKTTSNPSSYTVPYFKNVAGMDATSKTPFGTTYNLCALSGSSICDSSSNSNVQYDLCPAGWRLPTGGTSGEFQTLYDNSNYNSVIKMRAPISSGGAAFVTTPQVGSVNHYWSSTAASTRSNMHFLFVSDSSIGPYGTGNNSLFGSVRCILR